MPFTISETISEQDYDRLFEIDYLAFSNEPILLALFPGGLDSSARVQNVAGFKSRLSFGDPRLVAAKAVDEQTGQIVAFATIWMSDNNPFYPGPDSDVHLPFAEPDKRGWVEWVFNTRNGRRRTLKALQVPGPYGHLQVLATDPVRQREGAGTLLLKWAAEKIDSNGVRGMLEASSIAVQYGVYEKQGFRAVDEHTYVDKQRFSTAKPLTLVTMVREKRSD